MGPINQDQDIIVQISEEFKEIEIPSTKFVELIKNICARFADNETQNTKDMIAALIVGALGGMISKNTASAIMQITARAHFIRPAVLQSNHIIPIKIPKCNPERLIKCSKPVLRNAL